MEAPGAAVLVEEPEPSAMKVPDVLGSSMVGFCCVEPGVSAFIS